MAKEAPIQVRAVCGMHDEANLLWHGDGTAQPGLAPGVPGDAVAQHQANFELWHLEDEARDPLATDRSIVEAKRGIDRTNQRRNDLVERMDEHLLRHLMQSETAPLHSETPGMIVDRLSILSLKMYHTREESKRMSASVEHRARNTERLSVLKQQRDDLAVALDALLCDISEGRRRFKLYRQLKMYNDPSLNPVLYRGNHSNR